MKGVADTLSSIETQCSTPSTTQLLVERRGIHARLTMSSPMTTPLARPKHINTSTHLSWLPCNDFVKSSNIMAVKVTMTSQLTCTNYACILTVGTAMYPNATVGALSKICFTAGAVHVIIPNGTTTFTEVSRSRCTYSSQVAQMLAYYSGIIDVPVVIAHSAPFAIEVDFHTSFVSRCSPHQSKITVNICCMYN